MEPAAILAQLTASEDLPKEALRAASDRRADMAPLFVEQIENYVAADSAEQEGRALFFIFHLLGDWRETSAYRCRATGTKTTGVTSREWIVPAGIKEHQIHARPCHLLQDYFNANRIKLQIAPFLQLCVNWY